MQPNTGFESLDNDQNLANLLEHFEASIDSASSADKFWGSLGMTISLGEHGVFQLPHIYLNSPVSKTELVSDVRSALFAKALIKMSKEEAASVGKAAAQGEPDWFMDLVRKSFREQLKRLQVANT